MTSTMALAAEDTIATLVRIDADASAGRISNVVIHVDADDQLKASVFSIDYEATPGPPADHQVFTFFIDRLRSRAIRVTDLCESRDRTRCHVAVRFASSSSK